MAAPKRPDPWTEALERYEAFLAGERRSGRTINLRMYHMRRFAEATRVPPERVDTARLIDYMRRPEWGDHTRSLVGWTFRSFFAWSKERGVTPTNPAAAIPKLSVPASTPRPVSRLAVLDAMAKANPRARLMLQLAVIGGLKVMEIAHANTRDLQQNPDGSWTFRAVSTNGRAREVAMPDDLAETIQDSGEGYLFKGRIDGHVSPAYVSRLISKALPDDLSSEQLRAAYKSGQLVLEHRDLARFHTPRAIRILDVSELERSPVIDRHLARIEQHLNDDPGLAIGSCKELLESLFKILLRALNVDFDPRKEDLPNYFGKVTDALVDASPEDAREATKKTLRTLMTVVQSVGETRSRVAGHGHENDPDVQPRHARLIFNATVTVAEYTVDTWQAARG